MEWPSNVLCAANDKKQIFSDHFPNAFGNCLPPTPTPTLSQLQIDLWLKIKSVSQQEEVTEWLEVISGPMEKNTWLFS